MTASRSAVWNAAFRAAYVLVGYLDPVLRGAWAAGGLGITSQLAVRGRTTGLNRTVLVGLIVVNGQLYVGHPNGPVGWTANLRSAGRCRIAPRPGAPMDVIARPLGEGVERDAVITATARQQPFPANVLYWAARRHILSEGRYFRLEPTGGSSSGTTG